MPEKVTIGVAPLAVLSALPPRGDRNQRPEDAARALDEAGDGAMLWARGHPCLKQPLDTVCVSKSLVLFRCC
jgi:hypothetical protein